MRGLVKWWIGVTLVLVHVVGFVGLSGLYTAGTGAAAGTIAAGATVLVLAVCELIGYRAWRRRRLTAASPLRQRA